MLDKLIIKDNLSIKEAIKRVEISGQRCVYIEKNNKLIGLLLEQGQLINLDSKNHFSIIDKDDNEYLINNN